MCMDSISEKYPNVFRRLGVLQRIVRSIALFEGVVGLIALSVKLIVMVLKYDRIRETLIHRDEAARKEIQREELTQIVVLAFFVLQAAFALTLYEGARKKILCMIKAWLFFCFFQLLIPITMILCNAFLWRKQQVKIMPWVLVVQVGLSIFHGIEAIFILAFHESSEKEQRRSTLTTFEYHKGCPDSLNQSIPIRKLSDASFSVQIDSDHETPVQF